jgi:hypothetical protein
MRSVGIGLDRGFDVVDAFDGVLRGRSIVSLDFMGSGSARWGSVFPVHENPSSRSMEGLFPVDKTRNKAYFLYVHYRDNRIKLIMAFSETH